jgi:sugar phosphate isomerase/epimerase
LGLTLDAMNFYWFGHPLNDLYDLYAKYASRTFHTHCKNLKYPEEKRNVRRPMGWEYAKYAAPIYEGDIDYRRVAGILRKAGYKGDLCLENECLSHFPKDEQAGVLKKEIELLKQLA